MAILRIPSALRRYADGQAKISVDGATVGELLATLEKTNPTLRSRICDENGQVKHFINIFVNQDEIRTLQGLDSAIGENDEVSIIPAMAGGTGASNGHYHRH